MQRLRRSLWVFDIGLRRMNADLPAGWMAHMGVFCAFALALMAFAALGLPMAWPLAVIATVDLLATRHFVRQSLPRIRRLGLLGPTRARWWIEAAALDWTLCISIGVFAITRPAAVIPAWQQVLLDLAADWISYLLCLFFGLTVVGYGLGLIQGKRIRGRALELVNWFFWIVVVIAASMGLVPDDPVLTDWVAPLLAVLGVVALLFAGIMAMKERMRTDADGGAEHVRSESQR